MSKSCRKCLLPSAVSGADIDGQGLCRLCREPKKSHLSLEPDPAHRQDLEETLRVLKESKVESYHCLVPLSGGKDSLYLLYKLKVDYGLKVLAYTSNINLPPAALSNIQTTLARLEVDHIMFSPPPAYYRKLFRYLMKHQEKRGAVYTVSYVYAALFESEVIKLAIEKSIPIIFAGYSPGQPEPTRMRYEFSPRLISSEDWTPPHLKTCGEFSKEDLGRFYNSFLLPPGVKFPRYIAPFHAWDYAQDKIIDKVVELKLVRRKVNASPIFSNFPIHWLLIYSDIKHFGYNPYAPEFCNLIREGKSSRSYWKMMFPVLDFMVMNRVFIGQEVTKCLKWLDLKEEELAIDQPEGAYDPPLLRSH